MTQDGEEKRAAQAADGTRCAVLFSLPRTGSTMVVRQLNTHPRISFVGALFSAKGWHGGIGRQVVQNGLGAEWSDLSYRLANHRTLLDRLFSVYQSGCFGMKHHLGGDDGVIESIVADPRISVILLTRRNYLACFSSSEMIDLKWAEKFGGGERPKVTFNPSRFERFLRSRDRLNQKWARPVLEREGPVMEIDYTEARSRPGIERIVDFLGYDRASLGTQITQKRNSDHLEDRFSNVAEMKAFLATRGLEDWLLET